MTNRPLNKKERELIIVLAGHTGKPFDVSALDGSVCTQIDDCGSLEIQCEKLFMDQEFTGSLHTGVMRDIDSQEVSGPFINIVPLVKSGIIYALDIYKTDGTKPHLRYEKISDLILY
jgi:hypothetical protein